MFGREPQDVVNRVISADVTDREQSCGRPFGNSQESKDTENVKPVETPLRLDKDGDLREGRRRSHLMRLQSHHPSATRDPSGR